MKRLFMMTSMCLLFCSSSSSSAAATIALDGKANFDRNCSVCHSIAPPPKTAPPIMPLSNRYHLQIQTKKEGVNHMVAYLKAPGKAKAVDPQAITRFGLMPSLRLPDAELRAVAEWVWDQYNPNMGTGRGMGQGMGRKW